MVLPNNKYTLSNWSKHSHSTKKSTEKVRNLRQEHAICNWSKQSWYDLDTIFEKQSQAMMNITPPSQLKSELMQHQIEGLYWMYDREHSIQHTNPLFEEITENGKTVWTSSLMNSTQNIEPANVRGGLICDEMGMGKSIMILSLILISPPVGFTYPLRTSDISSESIVSSRTNPGDLNSSQDVSRSSPCITTLIVCPK